MRSGNLAVTTSLWSTVICMRYREMAVTAGMAAAKVECEYQHKKGLSKVC